WYALEPARMYDFAKIHQWSEQLRIWDAITDGIAVGIDGFHLPARSDNPTMHLLTCLTHSEAMFSAVLQFRATLWCSSTEIGSCARQMLEEGVVASHRAIELLRKGPPYRPEELGSLIGVVSSARRSLASISLRFEEGRKLHILSDISAGEDSRFKWYLRQRM
ncbi:MAG TPA: hypothetical protein PLL76_22200, partial [Thermoanaerobaculia bacterium]|nr:hypothetical protein [Thermoanaerobaculia bacterium]